MSDLNPSLLRPVGFPSWQDVELSMRSPSEWRTCVSSLVESYTSFLRHGVQCACGSRVRQPLLDPDSPTVGRILQRSTGIDLTEDDDDDDSGSYAAVSAFEGAEVRLISNTSLGIVWRHHFARREAF